MTILSLGDRANMFQIKRLSTGLKSDLNRLGLELSTGRKADVGAAVSGDFAPIAAIERGLRTLSAYRTTAAETAQMLGAVQLALGDVQDVTRQLSPGLLTAANAPSRALLETTAADARQKFDAVVARLNGQSAGRTLLSGAATDRPALASGGDLMAMLKAEVAGAATPADVVAAVDAWFDTPGGGFEAAGYLGSVANPGPVSVAEGQRIAFDLRADDPAVRATLKGVALAALVSEGVLSGDTEAQAGLIFAAASRLMTADGEFTELRARLGAMEAQTDAARARNAAEATALELALAERVGADPYDTATALEAVYGQIETLYTVTARIAGLRFTDYMR